MFKKDVPYGKIIRTLLTTQPLVLWFPVPIPGIVVLTASPIFTATFDFDFLKILDEDLPVILHEGFQHAKFGETQVCPLVFGWWQWASLLFCLGIFWVAGVLIDHHFDLTH
ncbi:MAG: hypothetical protein U5R30_03510 [Deltaproteobacteria bacterium]|nr:hypothetical protein [Deltaproteobacteria bacterium]